MGYTVGNRLLPEPMLTQIYGTIWHPLHETAHTMCSYSPLSLLSIDGGSWGQGIRGMIFRPQWVKIWILDTTLQLNLFLLSITGELGFQQQKILLCLFFQNGFFAFHMVHMVFIGAVPKHFNCLMKKGGKAVEYLDKCPGPGEKACQKIIYDADFTSIVTEVSTCWLFMMLTSH